MNQASPATPSRRTGLLVALIAGVTVVAFIPSLRGEFLNFDDDYNFTSNLHYRGLGPENLRWMFSDAVGHYMPLTWLTLALDYVLWGMNPVGYHATNVALHAINAVLLFFILRRLLRAARPETDEGTVDAASVAGAFFFSLHPLRVESVAWITERRDVLSCAFFLGSILLYLKFAAATDRRWKWLALSALSFTAMLLSKTLGLTLPFVLLILDLYPLRRIRRETLLPRLLEKLPHAALMAGGLLMLSFSAGKAEGVHTREQYSYLQSLVQPGFRVCFYAFKTLLPIDLSPLYWYRPGLGFRQIAGAVALLAATCVLVHFRRRFPSGLSAWVAYGLLIAPASGLVQFGSIFAADRYTYIPCLPFAALFAGAVLALRPVLKARVLGGAVAALLLVFAALTSRQCLVWRDSVALWTRAIELEPDVYFSREYRGRALAALRQWDLARADFDAAVALNPNWFEIWGSRARTRLMQGDPEGAVADATTALRLEPGWSEGHAARALALAKLGRAREAEADFSAAIEKRPQFMEARVGRANERLKAGDLAGALADFNAAIDFDPQPQLLARRGMTRAVGGDLAGAAADFARALETAPPDWPQRRDVEEMLRRARSERPR